MNDQMPNDSGPDRVRELESRVAELTRELESVKADRKAQSQRGRRVGDPLPTAPAARNQSWVGRIALAAMTVAVALATAEVFSRLGISLREIAGISEALTTARVDVRLVACAVTALIAILFYFARQPLVFVALAAASFYSSYFFFLQSQPEFVNVDAPTYRVLSLILLTAGYALFSWMCMVESRRIGRGRRRAALIALLNTLAFYTIAALQLARFDSDGVWIAYAAFTALSLVQAASAETRGPHRNYMFQLFLGAAIILANVTAHHVLTERGFLVVLGLECIVLAAAYHATGVVVLKVANLAVLALGLVLYAQFTKETAPVTILERPVPANWAYGLLFCGMLYATAGYYEHRITSVRPRHRRTSGHWFLADTPWDVPTPSLALLHAAAATLILIVLFVSDFGDQASLPFLLAAVSVALAVAGLLARTPQIEVGAVMAIIAAHVSFYFFLVIGKPGFVEQSRFHALTILMALYTFGGGRIWDKYLSRYQTGAAWEHQISAAVPYVAAMALLATLLDRAVADVWAPLAQSALGLTLLTLGYAFRDIGFKAAGVGAVFAAGGSFVIRAQFGTQTGADRPAFWLTLLGVLAALAIAERILLWSRIAGPGTIERPARTILVLTAGAVGFFVLSAAAPDEYRAMAWIGHASIGIVLGAILNEHRYRWTALGLIALSILWTIGDRSSLSTVALSIQFYLCAAVAVGLLAGSWGLSRRRDSRAAPPTGGTIREHHRHG